MSAFRPPGPANPNGRPLPSSLYPGRHGRVAAAAGGSRTPAPTPDMEPEDGFPSPAAEYDEHDGNRNNGDSLLEGNMYTDMSFTDLMNESSNDPDFMNSLGSNPLPSQEMPSQQTNTISTAQTRPNQKRSKNFSEEEDVMLVRAWINVSSDPIQGTNQSKGTFWDRVHEFFHSNRAFDSDSNANSLMHRWSDMQKAVNKFVGCLSQIEARRQSGVTIQDQLVDAQTLYKSLDKKNKGFAFMHCWKLLHNQPKWLEREKQKGSKAPTKKKVPEPDSTPTDVPTPNSPHDIDASTPEYNTNASKPVGNKRAKRYLIQGRDDRYIAAVNSVWDKKKVAEDEKEMKRDARFSQIVALEQERIKTDVAFKETELKAREKEIEIKAQEVRRDTMLDEERIMTMDISGMPRQQQEYYMRLRENIMNRLSGGTSVADMNMAGCGNDGAV